MTQIDNELLITMALFAKIGVFFTKHVVQTHEIDIFDKDLADLSLEDVDKDVTEMLQNYKKHNPQSFIVPHIDKVLCALTGQG